MSKVTPLLMFDNQLEAAIGFYTTTFPDSKIKITARTGSDGSIASIAVAKQHQVKMENKL